MKCLRCALLNRAQGRFSKQYWERLEAEGALSCEEDASDEPTSSLQSCSSGDSLQEKYERSLLGRCLSGGTRLKSSTNAIGEKRDMMHGKDSHASCTLARTDTVELCEEDASNAAGRSASTSTDRGSDSPTPAARKVPCAARAASSCRSSSSSSSSSGSGAVPASARSSSASSSSFVVHSVASSSVERRVRQERSDIVQQYEEYKQGASRNEDGMKKYMKQRNGERCSLSSLLCSHRCECLRLCVRAVLFV